ncbi:hypothetical protein ACT4UT_21935, partial [Bacillus sp. B-TM1]
GKKMYVVIVGGDNPKLKALPLISQFLSSYYFYCMRIQNGLSNLFLFTIFEFVIINLCLR